MTPDDVVGHVLMGGREAEEIEVLEGAEVAQVLAVDVETGLGHAGAVVGAV